MSTKIESKPISEQVFGVEQREEDNFCTFYPENLADEAQGFTTEKDAYIDLWTTMQRLGYGSDRLEDKEKCAKAIWMDLTDIPFREDEDSEFMLDQDWLGFKSGEVSNEDIWGWMEESFDISVGEWLNGGFVPLDQPSSAELSR